MDISSSIDLNYDFRFNSKTDEGVVCMKLGRRMQPAFLQAMHDGDDNMCDVMLFGVPPPGEQTSALRPIRSHKIILAYASKHLYDLFTVDGFIDSQQSEYRLEVVDHEHLRSIVECIYTDQLSVSVANAVDAACGVLIGADYLGIKTIADACEAFLAGGEQVKPDNCVKLWCFARKYGCLRLAHATSTLFAKHLVDMPENPQFLCMQYADCAKLLMSEAMCAADPDHRCLAAIAWLNHDTASRASVVYDILNMIPLTYGSVSLSTTYAAHEDEILREHAPNAIQTLASDMLKERMRSTAGSCLSNSSVYPKWYVVGGGLSGSRLFMHYDAGRRLWSKLPDLPWRLEGASATVAGNRLIVMGGLRDGFFTDDINKYNLQSGSWTTSCTKLGVARFEVGACSVGQNTYVLGGIGKEALSGVVERFDAASEKLVGLAPMGWKRSSFAVASMHGSNNSDNSIFVSGGSDKSQGVVEKYDICSNTWAEVGKMTPNRCASAGAMSGDDFYVVGGCYNYIGNVHEVEVFNIRTGQVRKATNLLKPRAGCSATTLYQGTVVCVLGGCRSGENLCAVECLDTREGSWSTGYIVPDIPKVASYFGLAVVV